jgi:hypothetical protein
MRRASSRVSSLAAARFFRPETSFGKWQSSVSDLEGFVLFSERTGHVFDRPWVTGR